MLVSDTNKFVFHHFPKTGGTSILSALSQYSTKFYGHNLWNTLLNIDEQGRDWVTFLHEGKMHQPIREIEDLPDYFSFAFVRNPFDLMVSFWFTSGFELEFDEFVCNQLKKEIVPATRWTQHEYLTDNEGNLLVDFVGKFENLVEDFEKIIRRIGVTLMPLPKLNVGRTRGYYKEYYNKHSEELVKEYYKKDLVFFDYTGE